MSTAGSKHRYFWKYYQQLELIQKYYDSDRPHKGSNIQLWPIVEKNRASRNEPKIWKSKIRHIYSTQRGRTENRERIFEKLKINWEGPGKCDTLCVVCILLDPFCLLWGLLCCVLCAVGLLAGVLWHFALFVVLCGVHSVVCVELKQSSLICLCSSVVGQNADT